MAGCIKVVSTCPPVALLFVAGCIKVVSTCPPVALLFVAGCIRVMSTCPPVALRFVTGCIRVMSTSPSTGYAPFEVALKTMMAIKTAPKIMPIAPHLIFWHLAFFTPHSVHRLGLVFKQQFIPTIVSGALCSAQTALKQPIMVCL